MHVLAHPNKNGAAMLPTLIHLIEVIRRALRKANDGMSMLAEVYQEAQELRRRLRRKAPRTED
jgi:hypothetical protein